LPLELLVRLAGIGQLALVAVSPILIPRILRWHDELAPLRPLTRQIFWTYAAYILCFNLAFGLISTFAPSLLIDPSPLAVLVSAFIAVYWIVRIFVQFFYYDRSAAPPGLIYAVGEWLLVGLFAYLGVVYLIVALTGARLIG
jgi:hypothetical protein